MDKVQYQIITTIKETNKVNVYLATVENYSFPVIVKRLKYGNREVFEALQAIQNEHLSQIYLVEETDEGLLVVEEYIEGELLADYLAVKKFTESEYINIAKQLCVALRVLHEHIPPLVHRDVKPSNVIVNSKGIVKLIDFDSARFYKAEAERDTRLLGTEKYAAPEQYGFSQTDCRSDIYSLGVLLGMFPRFTSEAKVKRWNKLVEKCTLFAPESRYQSVCEIEKELQRLEKMKAGRWAKVGMATGFLLFLIGTVLVLSKLNNGKETDDALGTVLTAPSQLSQSSMPMAEPETSPLPTTEPETSPTPTIGQEAYRTIKPEWRDIETDPDAYVALKQKIRDRNLMVMYCFKDRLGTNNFLVQVKELEQPGAEFFCVRLTSYETNREVLIEERFIEFRDNIVQIDDAYMKSLAEGYYKIGIELRRAKETECVESEIMLYVSESDVLEEQDWWLQNTTFTYCDGEEEKINVVLKNDSRKELLKVLSEHMEEPDASLYRLHCDGRALELSSEFLHQYCNSPKTRFFVMCTDGSFLDIRIDKSEQK